MNFKTVIKLNEISGLFLNNFGNVNISGEREKANMILESIYEHLNADNKYFFDTKNLDVLSDLINKLFHQIECEIEIDNTYIFICDLDKIKNVKLLKDIDKLSELSRKNNIKLITSIGKFSSIYFGKGLFSYDCFIKCDIDDVLFVSALGNYKVAQ